MVPGIGLGTGPAYRAVACSFTEHTHEVRKCSQAPTGFWVKGRSTEMGARDSP